MKEKKLEEAKRLYETANTDQKYVLESLFPELAGGEDDDRIRKALKEYFINSFQNNGVAAICGVHIIDILAWLEKQAEVVLDKDDIEAEEKGIRKAFDKIWDEKQSEQKPTDKVEPECEESKTKVFDAPTPFEDKLYAFVAACEFLAIPSKIEFILEHSQEILDAAREQIGKEQKSSWSEEDEEHINSLLQRLEGLCRKEFATTRFAIIEDEDWLKSLSPQNHWKPSCEQIEILDMVLTNESMDDNIARILRELREQLKKLREE